MPINVISYIQYTVVLHERDRATGDEANFNKLIKSIKAAAGEGKPKIGTLTKEDQTGNFADGWKAAVAAAEIETVDIASPIGLALAVKDEVRQIRCFRVVEAVLVTGSCFVLDGSRRVSR